MGNLISLVNRVFFLVAFILAGVAIWEKIANVFGMTLLRGYPPSRLLEFAAVILLFVVAMQLREIKQRQGA